MGAGTCLGSVSQEPGGPFSENDSGQAGGHQIKFKNYQDLVQVKYLSSVCPWDVGEQWAMGYSSSNPILVQSLAKSNVCPESVYKTWACSGLSYVQSLSRGRNFGFRAFSFGQSLDKFWI